MPSVPLPEPGTYPHHYEGYFKRVPSGNLLDHLAEQVRGLEAFAGQISQERESYAYEPEKWTVKAVVAHMIDTERVMAYRLMAIARGDESPLPGFDQDAYVTGAEVEGRTLASLVDEAAVVRAATLALARPLSVEAWRRMGTANHHLMSATAVAHVIYGHFQHHLDVLRTRYLD